jgi:hypothetical protein
MPLPEKRVSFSGRHRPRDYYCRLFYLSQRESVAISGRRFDNLHIIFLLELFWRDVFRASG